MESNRVLSHTCPLLQSSLTLLSLATAFSHIAVLATAFSHIAAHCYSLLSHCCPLLLQPSLTLLSVAKAFSHTAVRHCYSLLSHCCPLLKPSVTLLSVATTFSHSPLLQLSVTFHCYNLISQSIATAFSHIALCLSATVGYVVANPSSLFSFMY